MAYDPQRFVDEVLPTDFPEEWKKWWTNFPRDIRHPGPTVDDGGQNPLLADVKGLSELLFELIPRQGSERTRYILNEMHQVNRPTADVQWAERCAMKDSPLYAEARAIGKLSQNGRQLFPMDDYMQWGEWAGKLDMRARVRDDRLGKTYQQFKRVGTHMESLFLDGVHPVDGEFGGKIWDALSADELCFRSDWMDHAQMVVGVRNNLELANHAELAYFTYRAVQWAVITGGRVPQNFGLPPEVFAEDLLAVDETGGVNAVEFIRRKVSRQYGEFIGRKYREGEDEAEATPVVTPRRRVSPAVKACVAGAVALGAVGVASYVATREGGTPAFQDELSALTASWELSRADLAQHTTLLPAGHLKNVRGWDVNTKEGGRSRWAKWSPKKIQAVLESYQEGGKHIALAHQRFDDGKLASDIIYKACVFNDVNPAVVLAALATPKGLLSEFDELTPAKLDMCLQRHPGTQGLAAHVDWFCENVANRAEDWRKAQRSLVTLEHKKDKMDAGEYSNLHDELSSRQSIKITTGVNESERVRFENADSFAVATVFHFFRGGDDRWDLLEFEKNYSAVVGRVSQAQLGGVLAGSDTKVNTKWTPKGLQPTEDELRRMLEPPKGDDTASNDAKVQLRTRTAQIPRTRKRGGRKLQAA